MTLVIDHVLFVVKEDIIDLENLNNISSLHKICIIVCWKYDYFLL